MLKKAFFIILPSVMLFSACSGSGKNVLGTSTASDSGGKTPSINVELKEQSGSGQKGTATLEDLGGGKTKVTVTMNQKNIKAETTHIFTGDCSGPINVQYALTDTINGKSVTTLNVSLDDIVKAEPLAITLHPPVADWAGKYIACGDLQSQ